MPFLLRGDRTKNNKILPKQALLDGIHKDLLNGEGHDKWERSKKKRGYWRFLKEKKVILSKKKLKINFQKKYENFSFFQIFKR